MKKHNWMGWLAAAGVGLGAAAWARGHRGKPVSLMGKVALLSGASAGIGRVTAQMLAAEGCRLALVARRVEALMRVQESLPVESLVIPADLTQEDGLQEAVKRTLGEFGRIDILVNNAGLSMGGPLQEQDAGQIHKMVELNVYAPIRLAQLVLPAMLRQGSGHIVNVGSTMGMIAVPGVSAYSATRMAIAGFSDALRHEVGPKGIRVSLVLPGWVRTEMTQHLDWDVFRRARLLTPFAKLDEAEVPARGIVEALRYRRRIVVQGGLQIQLGVLSGRIAPLTLDWFFRWFSDPERVMEAMKQLGAAPVQGVK
jgi:short-subunit dehydrogenase